MLQPLSCYCDGESKRRSQKIDDLPILVTCQSGTQTAMVSIQVNGPVAYTWKYSIMPDMAHGGL